MKSTSITGSAKPTSLTERFSGEAPAGALQVATEMGVDPERVVIFHSLSKRSNLPGLRSGFVAAGPESMKRIKQLRAYAGAPLPLPIQRVSEKVWADEAHVVENRALYLEKFELADRIFGNVPGYEPPQAASSCGCRSRTARRRR